MRNSGSQQPDGTQLVGLNQSAFQFIAVSDIVEDNQAADLLLIFGDERCNGKID